MKYFVDFNLEAEELFAPYFNNPKIFKESYKCGSDDEYDSWCFIILSNGEYYYVSIINPDNGNNGCLSFTVKHIVNFSNEILRVFILDARNLEFETEIFSCNLFPENSSDINEYS